METRGRREQKKLDTREALEYHAYRLFRENGYEATSVDAIAEAAQVSARTFFRYFASKDDVLFGNHTGMLERLRALLDGRDPAEPIMVSIDAFLDYLTNSMVETRSQVLLQTQVAAEKVQVIGIFRQHHEEMFTLLDTFLAKRLPGPNPQGFASAAITGAAKGVFVATAQKWVASGGTDDADALLGEAKNALRTVLRQL